MFALLRAVVIRAEVLLHDGVVEYVAISDMFRPVVENEPTPEVSLQVRNDTDGNTESVVVVYP